MMVENFIPITPWTFFILGCWIATTIGVYFGPELIKKLLEKHKEKKEKHA